jgi:hypothetical protein
MKVKELLMALAIAVMTALFVGLLVDAVYETPEYDDFCDESARAPLIKEGGVRADDCEDPYFVYKEEIDACHAEKGSPEFDYDEAGCHVYSSCNYCATEFRDASEVYNRNLFYIITPLAVAALIFGVYYGFEIVASGFMFAGVLLLIYSTGRYFVDMSKILRVIVIFIELVLLLFITKKKMGKK